MGAETGLWIEQRSRPLKIDPCPLKVEVSLVKGQVAVEAKTDIGIQDRGLWRDGGLWRSERGLWCERGLRGSDSLCGKRAALKSGSKQQHEREKAFWHDVLFIVNVYIIYSVNYSCKKKALFGLVVIAGIFTLSLPVDPCR